jgi:hypothetical protein
VCSIIDIADGGIEDHVPIQRCHIIGGGSAAAQAPSRTLLISPKLLLEDLNVI